MARTKAQEREIRKKRYYPQIRLSLANKKACWLAKEDKNGYSFGLALGSRTLWLRNFRFKTQQDVVKAVKDCKVVFINLKQH